MEYEHGHRVAELRAIEQSRLVATRLTPVLITAAQEVLKKWVRNGSIDPVYAQRWEVLLQEPLSQIKEALVEDTEYMRSLRQSNPFSVLGIVTEQERLGILDAVK